LNIFQAKI